MPARFDGFDDAPDILAVFDRGIADGEIGQGDFVADGNGVAGFEKKLGIVLGDDAKHIFAFAQPLDDDDADIVAPHVRQKPRIFHLSILANSTRAGSAYNLRFTQQRRLTCKKREIEI